MLKMQTRFVQPVLMKVPISKVKELGEELGKIGYKFATSQSVSNEEDAVVIYTFYGEESWSYISAEVAKKSSGFYERIEVKGYNPKLFLALAAKTNCDTGNYGEYWVSKLEWSNFPKGRIFKQVTTSLRDRVTLFDISGNVNGFSTATLCYFHKAEYSDLLREFECTPVESEKDVVAAHKGTPKSNTGVLKIPRELAIKIYDELDEDQKTFLAARVNPWTGVTTEETIREMYKMTGAYKSELMSQYPWLSEQVARWEDLKSICGYAINSYSSIMTCSDQTEATPTNKNTFSSRRQAESMLAYAQLTQLIKATGKEVNWDDDECKYTIVRVNNGKIAVGDTRELFEFIAFNDRNARDKFMELHIGLLNKFFQV